MTFNRSLVCGMCTANRVKLGAAPREVESRVYLGDDDQERIAVCPIHDTAGSVTLLPPGMRYAMGLDPE